MKSFDSFAFCKMPNFDESKVRAAFAKAVPLSTVVIYCYDPRCDELPKVVAKHFREVHPGLVVTDPAGKKIASTSTMFEVRVAGGGVR